MLRERTVSWEISLGYVLRLSLRTHTKTEREEKEEGEERRRGETIHFIPEHFGSLSTFSSARKSPKGRLFPIGHEFLVASWTLHTGAVSHVA